MSNYFLKIFKFEPQLKGLLGLSLIVNVMHSQMDKTQHYLTRVLFEFTMHHLNFLYKLILKALFDLLAFTESKKSKNITNMPWGGAPRCPACDKYGFS